MATLAPTRPYKLYSTAEFEAFIALPANADRRFELIHGEIIEKMPTEQHAVIALKIGARILVHNETKQLGGRAGVEPRHKMPYDNHNSRLPDVAFTRAERLLPLVTEGSVPQMPDLAIEIKSPDDSLRDLREKASYYLHNGSHVVWLVNPENRTVEVCTLNPAGAMEIQTVEAAGTLEAATLLPDFKLPVKDIFENT